MRISLRMRCLLTLLPRSHFAKDGRSEFSRSATFGNIQGAETVVCEAISGSLLDLARIFAVLAVLAVLLLAANFFVGIAGGDFNAVATRKREAQNRLIDAEREVRASRNHTSPELEEARRAAAVADTAFRGPRSQMTLHMLLGSAAALVTVLVSSVTITYFIGTSRWCKEVCETYRLSPDLVARSTQLKRSTFPWALAGILSVIAVVGLGAAADPSGANHSRAASFVTPHYAAAMA